MKIKVLILITLALFGLALLAQTLTDEPSSFTKRQYYPSGYVPSMATAVASRDVTVVYMRLFNDDATNTGEVRAVDGTTNCGGSACPLFDVTIAPKSLYLVPMNNEFVKGGLTWQSVGTSTKIVGFVRLQY